MYRFYEIKVRFWFFLFVVFGFVVISFYVLSGMFVYKYYYNGSVFL